MHNWRAIMSGKVNRTKRTDKNTANILLKC